MQRKQDRRLIVQIENDAAVRFAGMVDIVTHYALGAREKVDVQAERVYGKSLPVNVTGAIGAIASELRLPWKIVRGIGVLARAIGLVGHILEEMKNPIAYEIKQRAEEQATAHMRN